MEAAGPGEVFGIQEGGDEVLWPRSPAVLLGPGIPSRARRGLTSQRLHSPGRSPRCGAAPCWLLLLLLVLLLGNYRAVF